MRYYEQAYAKRTKTWMDTESVVKSILSRQAQCFDRVARRNIDMRVLDVGAGDGTMLRLLMDLGYKNALGIELSEEGSRQAREKLGVQQWVGDFLQFTESGWDAILLWATIEHLTHPVLYLRHAAKLLNPGGFTLLVTGDNESVHAKIQGRLEMWVSPPSHLFYFNRLSLAHAFQAAGYLNFRCKLQFQSSFKESVLWLMRLRDATRQLFTERPPCWRGDVSNLLTAWGTVGKDPT
jgi:SAM-dependent methyltransferase